MAAETKLTNEGKRIATEHTNEYKYIGHADLSFNSLLSWQEGLVSVLFLVIAPFRKQNDFSPSYLVQYLLAA